MPWELIGGSVVAPGGALTALVMASGDSLTIRKSTEPKLLNVWADTQATGLVRVRSSLLHDAAQSMRLQVFTSEVDPLVPLGLYQPLQSQDALTVELSGSGVAGNRETAVLMLHYGVLPGSEGRYLDESSLRSRAVQPHAVENTLATAAGPNWTGAEAINVEFDNFKAEVDYALVGYLTNQEIAALAWRGPDTAQIRVGGPGNELDRHITGYWFARMSREYGLGLIPVINAGNKTGTNIDGLQDQAGTNPTISSVYMQMTQEAEKGAAVTSAPTSSAGGATPGIATSPLAIGGRRAPLFGARQVA